MRSRSNSLSGCDECSMPNPEMITLISEIVNTSTRMMSFKIIAAVWSFARLMFSDPMTMYNRPTTSF